MIFRIGDIDVVDRFRGFGDFAKGCDRLIGSERGAIETKAGVISPPALSRG